METEQVVEPPKVEKVEAPTKPAKPKLSRAQKIKLKLNAKRDEIRSGIYKELEKKNTNWEDVLNGVDALAAITKLKSMVAVSPPKPK